MYTLAKFRKSGWALVIYHNNKIIFRSKASALLPLLKYLVNNKRQQKKVIMFDQYVGRAAALLITLIKPVGVYTPVISYNGANILRKYKIPYQTSKSVKYLMNIASTGMCQWEKMSLGKSPQTFLKLVKKSNMR